MDHDYVKSLSSLEALTDYKEREKVDIPVRRGTKSSVKLIN
jgi:hypothetical protein